MPAIIMITCAESLAWLFLSANRRIRSDNMRRNDYDAQPYSQKRVMRRRKAVLISTNVQLGITLSHWVEHTIARIMNGRTIMSMIHIQFHPALQFKSHPSTPVEYRRY